MASRSEAADALPDWIGEESGWVEAKATCPHLPRLSYDPSRCLPAFDSACKTCGDQKENWLCLNCLEVLCGRFVNGDMLAHHGATAHPIALSFRDLSVWCFSCDSYLDAQVIRDLRPAFDAAHLMKFGTPAPSRAV